MLKNILYLVRVTVRGMRVDRHPGGRTCDG